MLSYVENIQRKEISEGVETLTHQKWSGADYVDKLIHIITGGKSSTKSLQGGNTEAQFSIKTD